MAEVVVTRYCGWKMVILREYVRCVRGQEGLVIRVEPKTLRTGRASPQPQPGFAEVLPSSWFTNLLLCVHLPCARLSIDFTLSSSWQNALWIHASCFHAVLFSLTTRRMLCRARKKVSP